MNVYRTTLLLLGSVFAMGTAWGQVIFEGTTPDGEPMHVETFDLQPSVQDSWGLDFWNTTEERDENDRKWKDFLSEQGISWPEGSYVCHVPALFALVVRNTQPNLDAIQNLCDFKQAGMIQVRASLWLVELEAAQKLGLDEEPSVLSSEEWASLRNRLIEHPGAEFLSCPTILTKNGQESTVKGNTEYTYPMGFSVIAGTNGTFAVEPQDFQVREVGDSFTVLPQVCQDGERIELTMAIGSLREPLWRDWSEILVPRQENDALKSPEPIKMPDFPCVSIQTSIDVREHFVYRLGGTPLDEPNRKRRLFYAFVSAEIVRTPKRGALKAK